LRSASSASLTFAQLSAANYSRVLRWHENFPEDGWSGGDWSNAMMGEVGEIAEEVLALLAKLTAVSGNAANTVKKLRRVETDTLANDPRPHIPADLLMKVAGELADTQIYLDLLARKLGIDLAQATIDKFDKVSIDRGFPERLGAAE
jgi:NTP pyrophosphatase (non-canonical NTP hydrolase)